MWGGGMMFNEIVVQEEGKRILDVFGIRSELYRDGHYTADAVEAISTLCSKTVQAGVKIFNLMSVEDVVVREERVVGLVLNWTAVEMAALHVDPLTMRSRYVIDATGHATEVVKVIERKVDAALLTPTGKIMGEKSLWAEQAELLTLENTKEVFPGVFVAGMSANASFGAYRMGPIFGGMLLSGEKAAALIDARLKQGAMKRIVTIAGSDTSGGAGIQADVKTIAALGGHGMTIITALTAQNSLGVQAVYPVPLPFIEAQLDAVFSDIGADAVKTGMLWDAAVVQARGKKIGCIPRAQPGRRSCLCCQRRHDTP